MLQLRHQMHQDAARLQTPDLGQEIHRGPGTKAMAQRLRDEHQTPLRDSNYSHAMPEHLPGGLSKSLAKGDRKSVV